MSQKIVPEDHKHVLGLQLPTDPRWVNMTQISVADILTDHAYCEQKAALTCISLIQTYSECYDMVRELSPVVTEEWDILGQYWLSLISANFIGYSAKRLVCK